MEIDENRLRRIADRTTAGLFTNGAGQKAHRLALKSRREHDLGGWAFGPVRDQILAALREVAKACIDGEGDGIQR